MHALFAYLYDKNHAYSSQRCKQPQKGLARRRVIAIYAIITFLYMIFNVMTNITAHAAQYDTSPQTPVQLLIKSGEVMKQLKSFHFNINMAETTVLSDKKDELPTTTVEMMGARVRPDQLQLQFSIYLNYKNLIVPVNEIIAGKKFYIQNLKGQWYILSKSSTSLFTDATLIDYDYPPNLIRLGTFKDNGTDTLNGVSVRHITVSFDKKALAASNQLWNKVSSQPEHPITVTKVSFDYWINEATSYVYQIQSQLTLVRTSSSTAQETDTIYFTKNYSKFNAEAITIPEKAIPASNLEAVFAHDTHASAHIRSKYSILASPSKLFHSAS